MKVNVQYALENFAELEAALDRGEEVEIARESRSSLFLVPRVVPTVEADGPELSVRAGLIGDWVDRAFLPNGFDSRESDEEVWAPFWAKLDIEKKSGLH